ncbi:hypothetical protein CSC3H3_17935 [Thalassospira marina]|uniref:Uncharacterized protein n=1 Tax=Thalassospira marina TaxID=2048283 RepID=A0ABN5FIB2_9PROT|nr:hypothetical protein CSC3H3_17935 [Thalassospira marina]
MHLLSSENGLCGRVFRAADSLLPDKFHGFHGLGNPTSKSLHDQYAQDMLQPALHIHPPSPS